MASDIKREGKNGNPLPITTTGNVFVARRVRTTFGSQTILDSVMHDPPK